MSEYKLIEAYSAEELNLKVTEALNDGYGTIGNPIITELFGNPVYAQAVVKLNNHFQAK
jgi:hypothetical protein